MVPREGVEGPCEWQTKTWERGGVLWRNRAFSSSLSPRSLQATATVLIKRGRAQGPFLGSALATLLGAMETEWELTREPNSNVFGMMRIVPETQQTITIILQFGLLSRCIVPRSDANQISTTSPLTSGLAPILLAPRKYSPERET